MKIKVYKSENGLDIDETYETTFIDFLYFLRIDKQDKMKIPKPEEKILFIRRGNTPVQMWYEFIESKGE